MLVPALEKCPAYAKRLGSRSHLGKSNVGCREVSDGCYYLVRWLLFNWSQARLKPLL